MFPVSTTDVLCLGHKDSSIPIKMEKLILKVRGEGSRARGVSQSLQLWTCGLIYLAPFQLLGIANGPAVIQTLWGCGTSSPRDCRQTGQSLGRARVPDLGAVAFPGIHRKGPCPACSR